MNTFNNFNAMFNALSRVKQSTSIFNEIIAVCSTDDVIPHYKYGGSFDYSEEDEKEYEAAVEMGLEGDYSFSEHYVGFYDTDTEDVRIKRITVDPNGEISLEDVTDDGWFAPYRIRAWLRDYRDDSLEDITQAFIDCMYDECRGNYNSKLNWEAGVGDIPCDMQDH